MTTLLKIWEYHYDSDFAAGVKLLIDHNGGQHLTKQTFLRLKTLAVSGQPVDRYNLGKLTGALEKIVVDGEVRSLPVAPPPTPKGEFVGAEAEIPATAEKLTSPTAKALHKAQSHHHALMVTATTDKQRAEHAAEILRLGKELDEEYDRLRDLQNPGIEEELEDAAPASRPQSADQLRRLQSLRTRIARLKNKLIPTATGKQKADWEKELEKKQSAVRQIENELA